MKKTAIILAIISFFIFAPKSDANAQCRQQKVYRCATKAGNAIYLRDFNTKLKKVKKRRPNGTRWAVVLNKDTEYRFVLCTKEGFEDKIVLTLFDSRHHEKTNPLAFTKNKNIFNYACQRTGMYYVSIRFKQGYGKRKTCAVGILSFVNKRDDDD